MNIWGHLQKCVCKYQEQPSWFQNALPAFMHLNSQNVMCDLLKYTRLPVNVFCVFSLEFWWNNMIYAFKCYFILLSTKMPRFSREKRKTLQIIKVSMLPEFHVMGQEVPRIPTCGKNSIWWHFSRLFRLWGPNQD